MQFSRYMGLRLYDAHNHLQDERLLPHYEALWPAIREEGVVKMWSMGRARRIGRAVLKLAKGYPGVVPSFGYNPW